MFAEAIETVGKYTRMIRIISRYYKDSNVFPASATLFFINDQGCAITCKHVAELIQNLGGINERYSQFKQEYQQLTTNKQAKSNLKSLESKYRYNREVITQQKINFLNCGDYFDGLTIISHPKYDLSVVKFNNINNRMYEGHAVFAKSNIARPGDLLCRLGFPFPEFSDYEYNSTQDDIVWLENGNTNSPMFPIEGMLTRYLSDTTRVYGIELSTPGLRGQSGGPLFDAKGIVQGMQSLTNHLHLGFDMNNYIMQVSGKDLKINNQPFLHVGCCIHVDVIKEFLLQNNIEFFEDTSPNPSGQTTDR